jgi:hypothetical protein
VNPKFLVFVAIIALAVALGGILLSGSSSFSPTSDRNISQELSETTRQIPPISVELNDISIIEVTKRTATIEVSFKIVNPTSTSMIVQVLDYQLFETGYSDAKQISGGQIGSRPTGMVEFGSNYYTLLANNSILLKHKIELKNTGNTPELWSALESNTAKWRVSGDVFFNLSSMTSGHENQLHFDFTK